MQRLDKPLSMYYNQKKKGGKKMGEYFPVQFKKSAVVLEKPSGTIAITDPMSIQQRKFYDAFLYVAKKDLEKDPLKTRFEIQLAEVKRLFGIEKDKNNLRLKKQIKKLMSLVAEYNILEKDKEIEWGAFSILPFVVIQNGKIIFEIPTPVKEAFLKKGGVFGKIDLVIIRDLNSKYSVILYELLKDYQNVQIPKMTIEKFRELFGLENKYTDNFNNLKRWVLDVAIKELNENPNIEWNVSYKLFKSGGNKYTHIKFIKIPKPLPKLEKQKAQGVKNKNYKQIVEKLMELIPEKYRKKYVKKLLLQNIAEKGYEYIEKQIEYTNKAKIKEYTHYTAYLRRAIEEDYAGVEDSDTAKKLKILRKIEEKYSGKTFMYNEQKYTIRGFGFDEEGKVVIYVFVEVDEKTVAEKDFIVKDITVYELDKALAERVID